MQDDHLPTPFSAEQIRAASQPGTRVAFLVEPAGRPAQVDRWEFLSGDARSGERRHWSETLDGEMNSGPEISRSSWESLQAHASYPAQTTTLTTETTTVPVGTFECWLYRRTDEATNSVTRAWFAPQLPGPPIRLESVVEGQIAFSMTLIAIQPIS